jgi:hypothetical protein
MVKLTVERTRIPIITLGEGSYISLLKMVKNVKNVLALIKDWSRNKNIIKFSSRWAQIYNSDFDFHRFEGVVFSFFHLKTLHLLSLTETLYVTSSEYSLFLMLLSLGDPDSSYTQS